MGGQKWDEGGDQLSTLRTPWQAHTCRCKLGPFPQHQVWSRLVWSAWGLLCVYLTKLQTPRAQIGSDWITPTSACTLFHSPRSRAPGLTRGVGTFPTPFEYVAARCLGSPCLSYLFYESYALHIRFHLPHCTACIADDRTRAHTYSLILVAFCIGLGQVAFLEMDWPCLSRTQRG